MQATTVLIRGVQTAVAVAIAFRQLRRAKQSHAWPVVEATIVESMIRSRRQNMQEPRITYAYTVDGRMYKSQRISVGSVRVSTSGNLAAKVVARYPAGSRVGAAVDPAHPSYSVLERGIKPGLLLIVAVCAFFALGGTEMMIGALGMIPVLSGATG